MSELNDTWARVQAAGPDLGVRSLFSFAHRAAEAGTHANEVEAAYRMAVELQDRDPGSSTYGNYRWYRKNARPQDLNAVEFVTAEGILTWNLHRDRLGEAARELLEDLLRMNVHGVRGHRVLVTYTNIFIKRSWNCIALGEAFDLPDLAAEGYDAFAQWCRYTSENGFHEYLSPTYYNVDLTNLERIALYAGRETERELARQALDHLWTDIGANWYDPAGRLGGAHSRDYDYIRGNSGGLGQRLDAMLSGADGGEGIAYPEDLRDRVQGIRGTLPRTVCQSWGHEPGQEASQYLTASYSIGSSGASRHNMDKVLTVNFNSGPDTPMMNLIMDGRRDPYGVNPVTEEDGHTKSRHLVPFVTRVQRQGDVLMLLSAGPETWAPLIAPRSDEPANPLQTTGLSFDASGMPRCLLSHLAIPSKARVTSGSVAVEAPDSPGEHALDPDDPILVVCDGAAVAVRTRHASTMSGSPASLSLVVDEQGLEHGVMRLTWTHADTEPDGRGTLVVQVAAGEEGESERLVSLLRTEASLLVEGDRVELCVEGRDEPMKIVADCSRGERISLEGGDPALEDAVLCVDGRDYAKESWGTDG